MLLSKLSSKSQVTIPKEVREGANLHPGDVIAFEVQKEGVVGLKRINPFDAAFHKSLSKTLDEWATREDEAAFHDL